ncbi:hypothetical protein ACSFBI_31725 [Variovorax sp. RB3P1]|uniref:hypothetical protein n=1 Tax=Variovorax sp. RB3P1 TaxID=3443732 RepID=UPI003F460FD0
MSDSQAVELLSRQIRLGTLPSVVLRQLMSQSEDVTKHGLAHDLVAAFPECEHWSLIDQVWHWKERAHSDILDAFFDFQTIRAIVGSGVKLPWTMEQCDVEFARLQPLLAGLREVEKAKAIEAVSFENLQSKIDALTGKLACIQALWDGDTNGWFVRMSAIVENSGEYSEHHLGTFTQGGDIRLFNGQVPPWPEAVAASEIGGRLAMHFNAMFHFPSPAEPNDSCAAWSP